jgi:serine/threonine protein kinase
MLPRKLFQSQPSTSSSSPQPPHHHHILIPLLAGTAVVLTFLLFFTFLCRRTRKKRTSPFSITDDNPPHRYSYSLLRRATNSFSNPLGHGGFGTVFSGTLSSKPIAVKLMDTSSHQGEREFHNELFFASKLRSLYIIPPLGFSSDPKRRRFLLVYPLMQNGNLQDALLKRKCSELFNWEKRFEIVLDIAKGLCYLHSFDPPVIHGDIKPSNILLDCDFNAKIGDFGLARLKSEPVRVDVELLGIESDDEMKKRNENDDLECGGVRVVIDDCGSMESVHTGFFEEGGNLGVEQSSVASPETVEMRMTMTMALAASPGFEKGSVKSEKDVVGVEDGKRNGKGLTSNSVRDWWWKQDNEVAGLTPVGEGKKVKDYVMDWIGREVKSEKSELAGVNMGKREMKKEKKNRKQKLEWWESMDEENVGGVVKKENRKSVREWWKEEYCEEVAKEKKKRKNKKMKKGVENDDDISNDDTWWMSDDALYGDKKKEKRRSRNNRGNVDWWLDGFSGELWRARRNSFDSASGDIPKSGGVSSTPSMRGTICYVAPEYGYGDDVSEKCDVYSFGILLLVIISGRRPLQVTGSPLSEFQRANLLSWARHCARNGKLIELVDESIMSLNKDQALICIKVALLCLLKSPVRRPSMKEVVGMLSGELEPPQLPVEYSPSTPSRFPFKSRKKGQGR